jgi:hypothetical protein
VTGHPKEYAEKVMFVDRILTEVIPEELVMSRLLRTTNDLTADDGTTTLAFFLLCIIHQKQRQHVQVVIIVR